MRIKQVFIGGYGRFKELELEFLPGLQVIIGPNEKGKSTIRSFIGDMLFGQKRSVTQRLYEDSNELRQPWEGNGSYGGRLVYELSDGRRIEVSRNFLKSNESIQVYDHTNARDITGEFGRLRNKELDFASRHLGVSKDVFLGTATISHLSLENLGDQDALNEIREKILSLADSGSETSSADTALKRLRDRVARVGQPPARTKPLPAARTRLEALEKERAQVLALQAVIAETSAERQALLDETARLREERVRLEEDIRTIELHDVASGIEEIETLDARINDATQRCFALSAVREFPLEQAPEVQRAENRAETARLECKRIEGECAALEAELAQGECGPGAEREVPEELEARFNELSASRSSLRERLAEAEANLESAEARLEELQAQVHGLPDFSRIAPDPVEWFTQLSSSFSVALNSRKEECEVRDRLREEVAEREELIEDSRALFGEMQDFPERAREYEIARRGRDDTRMQRTHLYQSLIGTREELADELPGSAWLAGVLGLVLPGALGWYYVQRNPSVLIFAGTLLLAIAYFGGRFAVSRTRLRRLNGQIREMERLLAGAVEEDAAREPDIIEELLAKAQCQTVRELEALHDEYRQAAAELDARHAVLAEQEERAAEAEERIEPLLKHYRETYKKANETVADEFDVANATGRVLARYSEYRDAKRGVTDARSTLERRQAEYKRLCEVQSSCQEELVAIEQEIRELMREAGFREERNHDSASGALRAYRAMLLQRRDLHGRRAAAEERLAERRQALEREKANLASLEKALAKLLGLTGAKTAADWRKMAEQAREYRELWERRTHLEEQRNALLRGRNLDEMRALVEAHAPLPAAPARGRDAIKAAIAEVSQTIDARTKAAHALHIRLTERAAGSRSLNEVEEECAAVARQVEELALELDSTVCAMALIEDIARDKHARIAPKLGALASGYLEKITQGAYGELLLSRNLTISVRIPQTERMNEAPEKSLSKGTVDQVYLALRLALVQELSATGEPLPMLLDDPFANYDDQRLEATMRLIAEMGAINQVLLFTCREDVARAAERTGTPVVWL